jgi:protein-S-isoprenylcysteine O-methyltransferase Ste14
VNFKDPLVVFREVTLMAVAATWFAFVATFWLRKKPPKEATERRDRKSWIGIGMQGAAYGITWTIRRPWLTPFVPVPAPFEIAVNLLAIALMVASVWITLAAIRTLGREWSFQARLVEGHRLITGGPFRIIRNPIYGGMLGMLLATGVAVGHWLILLGTVPLFLAGTAIRVRSEEALLRGAFGAQFEEYARRVPALIPGLW